MPALSAELRKSLDQAAAEYHQAIWEGTEAASAARAYLHGRGIDDQAILAYRLGVVRPSGDYASWAGMVSIPYLTRLGGCVSLKFRQVQEEKEPKYLAPPHQPARLYNALAFDRADRLGYIGITEGEIDALVLDYRCGIPAVGIPGADHWKGRPEWKELFRGYDRVLMFRDDDDPGGKLAHAIRADIEQCSIISLADLGKDVNAAWMAAGTDPIRQAAGI